MVKIYNLSVNIGGKVQEFTFIDKAGVNIVMRNATQRPNFTEATLETLSNGGDDLKPFFCEDFAEWDTEKGAFISE